jgi:hypothetical protein
VTTVMDTSFLLQFAFNLVGIVLWIIASVIYRKIKGKPLVPRKPDRSVFFERRASGCSNLNFLTKLGGARRCLLVAVTDNALIIQPMFPFNLMFLPEFYGLEHNILLKDIHTVEDKMGIFRRKVRLGFMDSNKTEHSIDLWLREVNQFLEALKK